MFNAASRVGAGVYGKRQKLVKTAFKILIDSADTSKTPRKTKLSIPVLAFGTRVESQRLRRVSEGNVSRTSAFQKRIPSELHSKSHFACSCSTDV